MALPPETFRLTFRELNPDDIGFVAEMMSHAEVMRFYPKPLTRDESMEWIQRQVARYACDGHGLWLVTKRDTGEPVGQVGLCMQTVPDWPTPRNAEVGYLLHRRHWGHGFATEAAARVRDHAFTALGYDEVISLIRPENEPSQGVALRLGMTLRGTTTAFHAWPHLVYATAISSPSSGRRTASRRT